MATEEPEAKNFSAPSLGECVPSIFLIVLSAIKISVSLKNYELLYQLICFGRCLGRNRYRIGSKLVKLSVLQSVVNGELMFDGLLRGDSQLQRKG